MTDVGREMFAWVTRDGSGRWSLIGTIVAGMHTPLVFVTRALAEAPHTRAIATAHGDSFSQPVKLIRFIQADILEEYP